MLQKFNSNNSSFTIDEGDELPSLKQANVFVSNKVRLALVQGEKDRFWLFCQVNSLVSRLIVVAERILLMYSHFSIFCVITSSQRRNSPQFPHSQTHNKNLLNNLLTKIQAYVAGVDSDALFNNRGFKAELNDSFPYYD